MARKRKADAITSAPPLPPPPQPQGRAPLYINEVALKESVAIKKKAIVRERGIAIVMPPKDQIDRLGWGEFAKADQSAATRSIVQEFYANLSGVRSNQVPVRGKLVDVSAQAINAYYGLPDIEGDGLSHIMEHHPTLSEISLVLTGKEVGLLLDWHGIAQGLLTTEAKCWSYFVGARLMPVVSHSDIHRGRTLCTYAILTGATVDVDRLIDLEIRAFCDGRANRALGFPVLITQLCARAGVEITPADSGDTVFLQREIKEKMFLPGEKVKAARQRAAEEQDEEEAHYMDHEEEQGQHEE